MFLGLFTTLFFLQFHTPVFGFSFKPDTECLLCGTVIRCGPGIDDVIRPQNSSKMITVANYCAQNNDMSDPKQRALYNVFSRSRFSYKEYQEKIPALREQNIFAEAKPLVHSTNLVDTNLQAYTNYVLKAVDPEKDKDLEVLKDGRLVDRLDQENDRVKAALKKSRMPSSEQEGLRRNGAWVSPEQDGVINPLKTKTTSQDTTSRRRVTPTPTPPLLEESFRQNYCRGKSDLECYRIWDNYKRDELKITKEEKEDSPSKEKVKPKVVTPSLAPSIPTGNSSITNSGNYDRVPASTTNVPSVGSSNSQLNSNPSSNNTIKSSNQFSTKLTTKTNVAISRTASEATLRLKNRADSILPSTRTINTSPVYRKVDIVTPYGTTVPIKLQPNGGISSADRPICENLKDWRNTTLLIDNLLKVDPQNELLQEATLGRNKNYLNPENYCNGTAEGKVSCEFDKSQAACSCKDYGMQYFADECRKKFVFDKDTPKDIVVLECHAKLKKIIQDDALKAKFVYPYAINLGETYLCLNISQQERKSCEDHVTLQFANMKQNECMALYQAVQPNGYEFVEKNRSSLNKYDWYKLYSYYEKQFGEMFGDVKLEYTIDSIRPENCKTELKGKLQKMMQEMRDKHEEEINDINGRFYGNQRDVKERITTLCKEVKCMNLFSKEVQDHFASGERNHNMNAKILSEASELSGFYRDLTMHYEVAIGGHCKQSTPLNAPVPNGLPPFNNGPSLLPGAN